MTDDTDNNTTSSKTDKDQTSNKKNEDTDKNQTSNKRRNDEDSNKNNRSSNTTKPSNNDSNSNNDQGFVPKVSSLNNSLRSEIRSAGANAGSSFRQSGGSESQLESVATQMFNDLEGDSPIQGSQISEARSIFVEAFKAAFYGN